VYRVSGAGSQRRALWHVSNFGQFADLRDQNRAVWFAM